MTTVKALTSKFNALEERIRLVEKDLLPPGKIEGAIADLDDRITSLESRFMIDKKSFEHFEQMNKTKLDNIRDDMNEIKRSLQNIYKIGTWFLRLFFGALIMAFVGFILKGGLTL